MDVGDAATDKERHLRSVELYLGLKRNRLDKRCEHCWLHREACLCARLPRFPFSDRVKEVLVYMDCKEMYNAGDDGKLLLIGCPHKTRRFIYALDDDAIALHLGKCRAGSAIVLFPSDRALSFPEWRDGSAAAAADGATATSTSTSAPDEGLTVVVVDAVWRHARRMAQRLATLAPHVPHVQLTPEQMSVYMRKQSQPDRICTVEAAALFFELFGEDKAVTDAMIDAVKMNNAALRPVSSKDRAEQRSGGKRREVSDSSALGLGAPDMDSKKFKN